MALRSASGGSEVEAQMFTVGERVFSMQDNQEGKIDAGPEPVLGVNWYWVELDDGTLSLVAENQLEKVDDVTDRVSVRQRADEA